MTAARYLAASGQRVTLLEASDHLGGKAGSLQRGGRSFEHGYHIFPKWYANVRALLEELRVELEDFDGYHYFREGQFPARVTVKGPSGPAAFRHNLANGIVPWYQTVLCLGFTLDLVRKPLRADRDLDRVSQIGLMRDTWYVNEGVAQLNHENMLKASAIPLFGMSALTAQRVGSYWLRQPSPFLSVLRGDLQTTFIDPYEKLVRRAGHVDIRFNEAALALETASGRLRAVRTSSGVVEGDAFVLTTPLEVSRALVSGDVYQLDPSLGNMHWLETQPMAALHVRLRRKLHGLPREHVFLYGGDLALSFIDVAQTWRNHDVPTELSFIVSNFTRLRSLSEDEAIAAILSEARRYLPIDESDFAEPPVLHPNTDAPLFINTVGSEVNRPGPRTAIPNLYMAGDYIRNPIDLACMEGAVYTGMEAARLVLRDVGRTDVTSPRIPPTLPQHLVNAVRLALTPALASAKVAAKVADRFPM